MTTTSNKRTLFFGRILAFGAHSDDVEIGCAGFLAGTGSIFVTFTNGTYDSLVSVGETDSGKEQRDEEAEAAAKILGCLRRPLYVEQDDMYSRRRQIIANIGELITDTEADTLLMHSEYDYHQDHRFVVECVLSAARRYRGNIIFYKSPSTRQEMMPNMFYHLTKADKERRVAALKCFESQFDKPYFAGTMTQDMESFQIFRLSLNKGKDGNEIAT